MRLAARPEGIYQRQGPFRTCLERLHRQVGAEGVAEVEGALPEDHRQADDDQQPEGGKDVGQQKTAPRCGRFA